MIALLGEWFDRGLRMAAYRAPPMLARAWMRRAERRLGADIGSG